ncbi:hypothetical protein [Trebonia sp.]|uniref:hypothetical protein n=1 Tax=Trebonia sp. TaxID=2767075 RepID=UPI0026105382|nr:hypothetical protein [Trebonia sp.]
MTADPLTAALDQLAGCHENISRLDTREAGHFASLSGQLTQLTGMVGELGRSLRDDTAALGRLAALDRQVAELAAQLAGPGGRDPGRYEPAAAPSWWRLSDTERQGPAAQLKAWVEQVYRPGYGHLAVTLGPCWQAHDLCLYGLDILAQLWSALYLQPARSTALLSAQAEYQARILPALAAQLMTETTGCGHDPARRQAHGYTRSMP